MNILELFIRISANRQQAVADLKAVEDQGKKTSSALDQRVQKLGNSIGKWVKRGALVAGAALAGLGVASLNTFTKIDTKMREVFTLMPGLSQKAKDQMTKDVMAVSKTVGVLPEETIPALYQAISAGVPPDNVFEFMETAGKAAKGGVTDIATAVDALTNVVNAYGSEMISAKEASDLVFTAVRLGKTTFSELGRYLFQVTPIAAAVGVSFDQIAAGMAEITAKGVPTRVAATQLRALLTELSKAGGEAADIFEELAGVTFPEFIAQGGDLSDALELMQVYAEENNLTMADLFGSIEAGLAALNLSGANLDSFRVKLAEMGEAAGATDLAFEEMAAGIQHRLDQLQAWWQSVQFNIGGDLQEGLDEFLGWLEANQDSIEQGLRSLFEGLLDGLKWIIDNKTAVKAGLSVIAIGFAAILAYTHPLAAGLTAITAATVGLVSLFDKASRQTRQLEKDLADMQDSMESYETRQEQAAVAAEKTAEQLEATRQAAAGLRAEYETMSEETMPILQRIGLRTTDQFWEMGDRIGIVTDAARELEDQLGDEGLTGVFSQFSADIEAAWAASMAAGEDWAVVMETEIARVINAYADAYPELAPLLQLIEDDVIQFQDIVTMGMEDTADGVEDQTDRIEGDMSDLATQWDTLMGDIAKSTEGYKEEILDILLDWAFSGEATLDNLLRQLGQFVLDMGKEWVKLVIQSQWAATATQTAAATASSAIASLAGLAAGVGGVYASANMEDWIGGGGHEAHGTLGSKIGAGAVTVAGGAAAGAVAGSFIPGIGTAIGALIGGGISLIDYLFPGLQHGGIVTANRPAYLHGTPTEPEGVFRLNEETFSAIGRGIVGSLAAEGAGLGGNTFNLTIESPVIRSEKDIDRLGEEMQDRFDEMQRGAGYPRRLS